MKISLPLPTVQRVGVRRVWPTAIDIVYDSPARKNRYDITGTEDSPRTRPIYEARLTPTVVFDYDFKAAQRITGVGQMLALSAGVAVTYGILIPVNVVGTVMTGGTQLLGHKMGDLLTAVGATPAYGGLRDHYVALIQKVRG